MFNKPYEIIEHTADIGIRVKGRDLKELFRNAGIALFQISGEKLTKIKEPPHKFQVNLKAQGIEELFVDWLNELLSLSSVEGMIFEDFRIEKLDENYIEAIALGNEISNFKMNTEIKAATYHELKVQKSPHGWQAEVIFDV